MKKEKILFTKALCYEERVFSREWQNAIPVFIVFLEKSEYAVTVPKLKETPNIM